MPASASLSEPSRPRRRWRLARLLAIPALIYLAAAGFMATFQRSFLFHPAQAWVEPATQGLPQAQRHALVAADGTTLSGWWIAPMRGDGPVFLYFHGNADGLEKRAKRFGLLTADGSGLLAMSYRGYGGSAGKPSEAALHADAERAYRDLATRVAPERIVIFGESLGTGVALNLGRRVPAKAIVLDSPYLSVLARGEASYPWLPVSWLLVDTFRSDLWISQAKAPVLIFHGGADDLIPPSDSERLAALGRPGSVTRKLYPGEGHVVPIDRGPHRDLLAFLAALPAP